MFHSNRPFLFTLEVNVRMCGRGAALAAMWAEAGRLGGRAHALLEACDLDARVLDVSPHGRGGDPLRVVRVVRARATAGLAVLGAVARSLGLGEARVAAEAGEGVRGYAAGGLDEVDDGGVALLMTSASWYRSAP